MKEFKNAIKLSLPVLGAYWFLGLTYGLLAANMGYPIWVSLSMALVAYSGSSEFIALTMLCSAFNPLAAVAMALMVGARHLFYGISMLDRPWCRLEVRHKKMKSDKNPTSSANF